MGLHVTAHEDDQRSAHICNPTPDKSGASIWQAADSGGALAARLQVSGSRHSQAKGGYLE